MSQLVDADTINVMIGETAGDLDSVVLPEDSTSVVGDMLEKHVKALGKCTIENFYVNDKNFKKKVR